MIRVKTLTAIIAAVTLMAGAAQAATVKIGFNVPLTGFAAADGKSALNGAELAVEHFHEFKCLGTGGYPPQGQPSRPPAHVLQQTASHAGWFVLSQDAPFVGGDLLDLR